MGDAERGAVLLGGALSGSGTQFDSTYCLQKFPSRKVSIKKRSHTSQNPTFQLARCIHSATDSLNGNDSLVLISLSPIRRHFS